MRIEIAGRSVTEYLQTLLRKSGHTFHTTTELEIVRSIKEKLCFVSSNPTKDEEACAKANLSGETDYLSKYTLPDGREISLTSERFRASEILFRPSILGSEYLGVHEMVSQAISKSQLEMRRTLYADIVLAGGTTKCLGFGQRLLNEVTKSAPKDTKVRVFASPERHKACWIGGSIFASLGTFKDHLITRRDYH
eukprot:c8850_g1_i3.p2 GENE.c8850_g1_i3~~c8850_g1_i3.p2  ORF type:complete len:194 (-),score=52.39 c8850_g1_i3:539-1120(-)